MRRLVVEVVSPQGLLAALEDLVKERRLSQHEAHVCGEAVLRRTGCGGQWHGVPAPRSGVLDDVNHQIAAALDRM
jgi:hypothetical protein